MLKTLIPFLLVALFAAGCTFTTTLPKNPKFSEPVDSLRTALNQLVTCQRFNLDGKEITTNGKPSAELEVSVINGRNIPADDKEMGALAKQIAVLVKDALSDNKEYDKYRVLFVTEKINGNTKNSNWVGMDFNTKDL